MLPYLLAGIASRGNTSNEGDLINLTTRTVFCFEANGSPYNAEAGFVVRSDGKLDLYQIGDNADPPPTDPGGEWVIGYPNATYAADFEVFVSEVAFVGLGIKNGTMDTWIDCSTANSNRDWSTEMNSPSDSEWTLNVQIRHKTSMVVYANENIKLNCVNAFD